MGNEADKNIAVYAVAVLPAVLTVFVIFFLVMPRVRENRRVEEVPSGVTNAETAAVQSFDECVAAGFPVMESHPRQCATQDGRTFVEVIGGSRGEEPILGGDRDEHGCIGSAGYTWCEAKEKCLRVWEEECETAVE